MYCSYDQQSGLKSVVEVVAVEETAAEAEKLLETSLLSICRTAGLSASDVQSLGTFVGLGTVVSKLHNTLTNNFYFFDRGNPNKCYYNNNILFSKV